MDGYDAREQAGHEPYGPHDGSSPPSSPGFALRGPGYLVATAGVCSGAACPEGVYARRLQRGHRSNRSRNHPSAERGAQLLPRLWVVYWFSE